MKNSLAEFGSAVVELTGKLSTNDAFSYLRLGDGETQWILAIQKGQAAPWYRYSDGSTLSLGGAVGTRGLEVRHYERLMASLEKCSYLDYCEGVSEANRRNLAELKFERDPSLARNPSRRVSNIVFHWSYSELKNYLGSRRCLFASAEAGLHRELYSDPTYKNQARGYFPEAGKVFFHQIREDGRNYSENLDLIKDDLAKEIRANRIDTLFLSLATGAKILCYELACELNVQAIDWGAMSRALTYCGSPGYHAMRADHTPFFLRVPFETYMDALERANPEMPPAVRMLKAHSQLMLELQKKTFMSTTPADVNTGGAVDMSAENLKLFWEGLSVYRRRYAPLARHDAAAKKLHRDFCAWQRKLGLGVSGWAFVRLVRLKGLARQVWRAISRRGR